MFSVASIIAHLFRRCRIVPSGTVGCCHVEGLMTVCNQTALLEMVKSAIPPLSTSYYKGQAGRVGAVGGSLEYTGAPYFAAISALKVGADLSHVFCSSEAAAAIKSYSPELIVHPLLDNRSNEFEFWLPRLHSLVVGPGLGREDSIMNVVTDIITQAKKRNLPIVIDADGLYLVTKQPDIIEGYKRAILTPNKMEFIRLYEKMFGKKPSPEASVVEVKSLCEKLGNVTICHKGQNDIISDGKNVLVCCEEGSLRRCGGQGDLLSGSMGIFTHWTHQLDQQTTHNDLLKSCGPSLCAAYAACLLTRRCSKLAFQQHRRSMTTSDMIAVIQQAFEELYL
ncbi:ATP-dependent (S)-NAD(P)H-hydrate dehydratase-like [Gigantopelta aegis]|uniref:ATP-dependent (S)-NAD(P)H-hydrate dehydratase-like n=1 Tax=Gigantopelta aegis TaxID=1735272 RepID=UPI001B88BE37|nr:ATP-dependent (S)-NAD(P)H-hydrate dehydratase-like [Gigantopelta aegis]